jgi:SAM-dependent methyltransferase
MSEHRSEAEVARSSDIREHRSEAEVARSSDIREHRSETWSRRRTSFGRAASNYALGRPHYPADVLRWCAPENARTALDVGAGTGILTRDLLGLDLGLDVIAVEPLAEMRALLPAAARAIDGSAEAIPLPDGSVDAVFVGSAWHWFDTDKALAEAHRVLRPGGTLALLWILLDVTDPLTASVADVLEADERSDMMLDSEGHPPYDAGDRFSPPARCVAGHGETYDAARLAEYAMSRSQTILLEPVAQQHLIDRLRAAVPDEPFTMRWVCEAWRATVL